MLCASKAFSTFITSYKAGASDFGNFPLPTAGFETRTLPLTFPGISVSHPLAVGFTECTQESLT